MGIIDLGEESTTPDVPSTDRIKIYPKSDGMYYRKDDGDEEKFGVASDFDASLVRNYYVSKNGNDTSGDGSLGSPFLTIGACITYVNANETLSATNNAIIMVTAGEYTEAPFTLPRFCSLWGTHYRTRITASNSSADLITTNGANTIRDVLITGVTSASHYHIRVSAIQATRCTIESVNISNYEGGGSNLSNGIYISSTTGTVTVRVIRLDFNDLDDNIIELGANARMIGKFHQVFDCSNATYLKSTGNSSYSLNDLTIDSAAIGSDHGCTGASDVTNADFRNAVIPLRKSNNGELITTNNTLVSAGAQITNFENFKGYFFDLIEGEPTLRIVDELSVGLPGQGKEMCIGEGDSYTLGIKVYSYDGVTFTDESEAAASSTGSTFTFPSSGTTRAIYVATQRTFVGSTTPLKWFGIKANVATAASDDGEIVSEYWDGSAWTEFNTLSTASSGSYYPYGNTLFERNQSEQIRFTDEIDDDWAVNDPVLLGADYHWVRFRCATVPTTLPVFQQLKVHSNRTEINSDGFMEHFGKARPIRSVTLPNFEAANNSPANADIYFQDNMGCGKVENNFQSGAVDQATQIIYLPASIDTSCPIRLNVVMFSSSTNTSDADWIIRWIVNRDGDPMYDSTNDAPTTNPRVLSKNVSVTPTGVDTQFTLTAELDVSEYIAYNSDKKPDVLGLQIQRNGNTDSHTGSLRVAVTQVFYATWCQGEHIG